jgi:serine/threonine-protein kinase
MGAVWRARNVDLDVEVALKLIRADAALADGADRLLREAQAAAKLTDPAIVRVFDFGKSETGDPFIVMELLDGEDLSAAIQRRGRLSPKRAVRVLLPVVRALAVAHGHGIVHRDLKPENIFLTKSSTGLQPKVVDFGIAQLDQSTALRLTSTGALMGSPLYMSPEQAKGESVDFRADIWSLSVVLYEALTGGVPFPGQNYNAVLCSVLLKEPERPAGELEMDDELWSIMSRGLNKEPSCRFGSMQEFGKALAHWLVSQGEHDDISGASLDAQWLIHNSHIDQLSTVFPPSPLQEPAKVDRRAPTERLRLTLRRLTQQPEGGTGTNRAGLVALAALGLVLVAAVVVSAGLIFSPGPKQALPVKTISDSGAKAALPPAVKAAPAKAPSPPGSAPDSAIATEPEPSTQASLAIDPPVDADEEVAQEERRPATRTRQARSARPTLSGKASKKRASKLKNPFGP